MSLTSGFLTLSIKSQLWITILILTVFSFLVILALPGSFSYEILMEDYKRKKKFFYNEYLEYIQATYNFQSFKILKYEEIIKRMAKQIYKYNTRESSYEYQTDLQTDSKVEELLENSSNEKDKLYYYCYDKSPGNQRYCQDIKKKLINKYESLDGLIFSHDVINRFKDPGFSSQIIDSFLTIDINYSMLYGFNKTGLYSAIVNNTEGNSINDSGINSYYQNILNERIAFAINDLRDSVNSKHFLYHELFSKVLTEIEQVREDENFDIITPYDTSDRKLIDYAKTYLGFYSKIDLSNNKCYLINSLGNIRYRYFYYFQFNLIKNYLDIIGNSFSNEQNMDLIPVYPDNFTIISPGLCTRFLMKQSKEMFNEKIINQTYNKIKKGVDGIEACIYDKKILENKMVKEMFNTNITHFLNVNNKFYQGIIELDQPYLFLKAPFPNLNVLKEFKTDYLLLDEVDFYLFAPFKEPIEFANYVKSQYQNLFYLIVVLILYVWIICFIVNMIIYCKIAKLITEPIYKLQEAIENNNIKDEKIFKYEYDDIINELFITCKELLTGQIDVNNSQKYTSQFNILNKQKDKDKIIDKSKYEKNLIINNEIVNKLINEEQNMMNFKDEIDFNDNSTINHNINEKEVDEKGYKKISSRTKLNDIEYNNENKEKMENIKQSKNKEEEDKDKNSYKSMFRLAQYLYYYRCKVEENNIIVSINPNNEEKKSIRSRINDNNQNPNIIKNNTKNKKSISRSGFSDKIEENFTINVLRDKNITYLWYMEMKKKNNRCFNYQLSEDLEELFID